MADILDHLYVVLLAMTPVGELRLSVPWGIHQLGQPWYLAFLLSLIGNIVPALILPWMLGGLGNLLLCFPNPLGRLLSWRRERLRTTHGRRFQKYGALALVPFVAIPLPFTGVWTGILAAWAFDIRPNTAIPLLCLGVLIAGIIVTSLTVVMGEAWQFFL
ncbi:MAG TPA: small multi-drug export protein [Dehalococcoidia bacterium]|jgi:uncharacterized membrane protein|nr:small multi-drug export protein [Dehalococcoidia bacterium]